MIMKSPERCVVDFPEGDRAGACQESDLERNFMLLKDFAMACMEHSLSGTNVKEVPNLCEFEARRVAGNLLVKSWVQA